MKNGNGYFYYPGCSLKGTAKSYEKSLIAVFEHLGIELPEVPDWNCCGATSYMAIDEMSAFAMAARNLAIAENNNKDIIAPCSACYMVLNKAKKYIEEYPEVKAKISSAIRKAGLPTIYQGKVKVIHPLYFVINNIGLNEIQGKIKRKLNGIRVFCYYGCLIVRPFTEIDDPMNPTALDKLVKALGAEYVEHPLKTKCCGGSLTGTIEDVGLRLSYLILREAKRKGAHLIVTTCPLCQFNLEAYQGKMKNKFGEDIEIPVLYFTQLMGVAFEIPVEKLGFNHHLIYPDVLFQKAAL